MRSPWDTVICVLLVQRVSGIKKIHMKQHVTLFLPGWQGAPGFGVRVKGQGSYSDPVRCSPPSKTRVVYPLSPVPDDLTGDLRPRPFRGRAPPPSVWECNRFTERRGTVYILETGDSLHISHSLKRLHMTNTGCISSAFS
jgi:hypothetical protein